MGILHVDLCSNDSTNSSRPRARVKCSPLVLSTLRARRDAQAKLAHHPGNEILTAPSPTRPRSRDTGNSSPTDRLALHCRSLDRPDCLALHAIQP